MIVRHYKPDFINAVINDPSVKEGAEVKGFGDLSEIVQNLSNFVLVTDLGGFVAIKKMPGLYECHTQFLPEGRGAHAVTAAKEALRYMFINTDCVRIITKAHVENKAVQHMAAQFFKKRGRTGDYFYYSLDIDDWIITDEACRAEGESFHAQVEGSTNHGEDKIHDCFAGATWLMARASNMFKAQLVYNRWALMSGYDPILVLSETPLIVMAGNMKLAIEQERITCL